MNLNKLVKISKSNWEMIGLLQEVKIIPQRKICVNGNEMYLEIDDKAKRNWWRCKIRCCRKYIGIRCGTWLEGSKLGLEKVLMFMLGHKICRLFNYCKNELGMGIAPQWTTTIICERSVHGLWKKINNEIGWRWNGGGNWRKYVHASQVKQRSSASTTMGLLWCLQRDKRSNSL